MLKLQEYRIQETEYRIQKNTGLIRQQLYAFSFCSFALVLSFFCLEGSRSFAPAEAGQKNQKIKPGPIPPGGLAGLLLPRCCFDY